MEERWMRENFWSLLARDDFFVGPARERKEKEKTIGRACVVQITTQKVHY